MKILITGGAGFIGSTLCRYLVQQDGCEVINLDKLTYAADLRSLAILDGNPAYRFIEGDILDAQLVATLLSEHRPNGIINLAAETHVDRSIEGASAFIQTNILGTFNLLQQARSYWERLSNVGKSEFRFLHVSTDEVFGSLGQTGYFEESSRYAPTSPYSASKASSDHLVQAWQHTYGLPTLISNCSNNYGPYQFPEKLIPLMIIKGMQDQPLPVYGDGQQVRDWLHVQDHVEALHCILTKGIVGQSYLVGGHNEQSNLSIVRSICDRLDHYRIEGSASKHALIQFVQDRPGHDRRYAVDASLIARELGWKPKLNFAEGLAATIDWYVSNQDWWQPLINKDYDGRRLGLITG